MIHRIEQPSFLREDEKTEALQFGEEKAEVYKITKAVGKCRNAAHQIPQYNSQGTW